MVRIHYQRAKCIGCNGCVEAHPERWRISRKDGRSTLIGGENRKGMFVATVNNEEYDANLLAAKNCPVNIIRVELA
ncbi:ferredoxin [bacterium]|nr:ferredoxin [bacterium]